MKADHLFSKVFCIVNGVALLIGILLWVEYSLYRTVILYSLFNIVVFWLTEPEKRADSGSLVPKNLVRLISGSVLVLFAYVIMLTSRSLFVRPIQVSLILGAILVLFILVTLANSVDASKYSSFLGGPSVHILTVIAIVLYAYFSIYLVQPGLMDQPFYASMDAYRDYTNGLRILIMSRIDPEKLLLQQYYRPFPLVPMEIAIINLITNLPLNVGHLLASMVSEMLTLVCCVGLSRSVVRNHQLTWLLVATLSILVLFLQPILIDPGFVVMPIRFSTSILSLIFYLCYSRRLHSVPLGRSVAVSIILLIFVTAPLHATTSMFLVLIFALLSLRARWNGDGRHSMNAFMRLSVLTSVCFLTYLTSSVTGPFSSLLDFAKEAYIALREILTGGIPAISEKILQTVMSTELELSLLLQSVGMSLLLSVFTVFLLRTLQRRHEAQDSGLFLLHACCGALLIAGIGLGRLMPLWQVDTRFIVFPLIPVATMLVSSVIKQILANINTVKRFVFFAVLVLHVLSMLVHPAFLHETDPTYARMIPTTSESAAALFVQARLPIGTTNVTQVVTDWPFYGYLRPLLYSHNIGLENVVEITNLMYDPMRRGRESIILSRRYFLENPYLSSVSPYVAALRDVDKLLILNRVCDAGSTSVYWGTPR
jgi:hypothetical protein